MDFEFEIKHIDESSTDFPEFLLNIKKPVKELYYIGNISLLKKPMVAVVGSRKCSEYGKTISKNLGEKLSSSGISVVSGMALGIDTFAHLGAMKSGCNTIAVLGSGIDVPFPKSNIKVYEEIGRRGLIISEYPPGTEAMPWQFPLRNRIIAGISDAVVVVEAMQRSGSLITAELAVEYGKTVYGVPGNITSTYSLGTNRLISQGAQVLITPEDLITDMGIIPKVTKEDIESLSLTELEVYKYILERGETCFDELISGLQKSAIELTGICTVLELKGMISFDAGKIFLAKL